MATHESQAVGWIGLASLTCYFGAVFLPVPDAIVRLLAFAFGPLLIVGLVGLHTVLKGNADPLYLRIGLIFGIIAGALVTTLLTIQIGNQMWLAEGLAEATDSAGQEAARATWRAVNRVQALMDVSWDIFLCSASVLMATAMFRHAHFGRLWGGAGVALALLLLGLNLQTFPAGPAYAGSIDAGPFLALWYGAVFIRMILPGGRSEPSPA